MPTTTPLPEIRAAVPCGAGLCDSEEGRRFLQQRQALFGKIGFACAGGLFVIANAILILGGERSWSFPFTDTVNLLHLGCFGAFGLIWVLSSAGSRSRGAISLIDAGGTLLIGVLIGLIYGSDGYMSHHDYPGIAALTLTLFVRAFSIPSTTGQTATTSLLASIPVVIGYGLFVYRHTDGGRDAPIEAGELEPAIAVSIFGFWCFIVSMVATVASRVTYGLQMQVRDARELGQYTLEERIGKGGMGEVYRASHAFLRRPTAVKVLRPEQAGERSLARFEREVQLTSRLTHPNTIAIYDYGRTPEGIFYYAMEYLGGTNLEDLVRRSGPQPPARVIHILRQICASLTEAHGTGLIHRDIKPANVFLSERGGIKDVVKVLDFGLVKDIENTGDVALSGANTITGSPMYLSPEAISSPDEIDGRSDLYAVGCVGYFLLTGAAIFDSENVVEVVSHHLRSTPERPSKRVEEPLPDDLENLVLECLEKDKSRRPADAKILRDRLGRCADAGRWTEKDAEAWWAERPAIASENGPGDTMESDASTAARTSDAAAPTVEIRPEEMVDDH